MRVRLEASATPLAPSAGGAEPCALTIYNLSRDGFLIDARPEWPVGQGLRILLPEVGLVEAGIARVEPDLFGCTFVVPLSQAELDRSAAASTVVWPDFVAPPGHAGRGTNRPAEVDDRPFGSPQGYEDEPERWPRPVRAAIALGSGLLLWGMIVLAVS